MLQKYACHFDSYFDSFDSWKGALLAPSFFGAWLHAEKRQLRDDVLWCVTLSKNEKSELVTGSLEEVSWGQIQAKPSQKFCISCR